MIVDEVFAWYQSRQNHYESLGVAFDLRPPISYGSDDEPVHACPEAFSKGPNETRIYLWDAAHLETATLNGVSKLITSKYHKVSTATEAIQIIESHLDAFAELPVE